MGHTLVLLKMECKRMNPFAECSQEETALVCTPVITKNVIHVMLCHVIFIAKQYSILRSLIKPNKSTSTNVCPN